MFSSNTAQVSSGVANYIEDVFSTYLHTGTGASQTITNGIDLATKGGLVWIKERNNSYGNALVDTARGTNQVLFTNSTGVQTTYGSTVTIFNSNGFTLGNAAITNDSTAGYEKYVSWTFRKQPKFFDVVTWTGNETVRTINHNLGSVPGCIMIKQFDQNSTQWAIYHRSLGSNGVLCLNDTSAFSGGNYWFNATNPTSTEFTVGVSGETNQIGKNFVAYLFAHNAGGFGLTGTDNVISCGSYTGTGTTYGWRQIPDLGFDPQWMLIKKSSAAGTSWVVVDSMRGLSTGSINELCANSANPESDLAMAGSIYPTAQGSSSTGGFIVASSNTNVNELNATYIYVAIRRGPMKLPTDPNQVLSQSSISSDTSPITTGFPVDLCINLSTASATDESHKFQSRIQAGKYLKPNSNLNEFTGSASAFQSNTSVTPNVQVAPWAVACLRQTPKVFDMVSYELYNSANGQDIHHNLNAIPELIIIKQRTGSNPANSDGLVVAPNALTNYGGNYQTYLQLFSANYGNSAEGNTSGLIKAIGPNINANYFGTGSFSNASAQDNSYIAYLFASYAGVSKVGAYTGTGTTQEINCGFSAGARFLLIKKRLNADHWWLFTAAKGLNTGGVAWPHNLSGGGVGGGYAYFGTSSVGFSLSGAATYSGVALNTLNEKYMYLAIA
jgi:hypothetical protein